MVRRNERQTRRDGRRTAAVLELTTAAFSGKVRERHSKPMCTCGSMTIPSVQSGNDETKQTCDIAPCPSVGWWHAEPMRTLRGYAASERAREARRTGAELRHSSVCERASEVHRTYANVR